MLSLGSCTLAGETGRRSRSREFLGPLTAACMIMLSPSILFAQESGGGVKGHVTDAGGVPLAGASVLLSGTALRTRTDSSGYYIMSNVPAGEQTLSVRLIGYSPVEREVMVPATGTLTVDFSLSQGVTQLAEVTVVGTREDQAERREQMARIPGSVDLITSEEIRDSRQANLKDVLMFTPGVFVQPRFGAADESQISIRGSGLRNNFHARGINLLVNGMPYRNADGFTDFESLELLTTEAIEVYKGANAFRYGGSTLGGAINLITRTGYTADPLHAYAQGGSFGYYKAQASTGGNRNGFDWYGSYARTSLDGYRDWSAQSRDRVNLHAGYVLSPKVDLRTFYFFADVQEHLPGSLTRAELDSAPRSSAPGHRSDKWGRNYQLHHLGLQLRTQLSPTQRLQVSPYYQYRDIDHPIFQVINQQSQDIGAEVRYENTADLAGHRNRLTLGFQPAFMDMHNRQFENEAGEHGALTKDQTDKVYNLAFYAEDMLQLGDRLSAVVGARFDHSLRKSKDHFLSDGDQTTRREFNTISPRFGMLYDLPEVSGQIYANASETFEPPLLLELNSLTLPGFIDLQGQSAWQFELGTRGRSAGLSWDVAVYDIELRNEILNINVQPFPGAPFTVPTYRNSPETRHYGLEAGLEYQIPGSIFTSRLGGDWLTLRGVYTYAQYKYVEDSSFAGNDIPGAPNHHLVAELRYSHPSGWSLGPIIEWVPASYFVDSDNTTTNEGWALLNARADWSIGHTGLSAFMHVRNITDTNASPSVQVDNANGRFYEPVDGRSIYAGLMYSN